MPAKSKPTSTTPPANTWSRPRAWVDYLATHPVFHPQLDKSSGPQVYRQIAPAAQGLVLAALLRSLQAAQPQAKIWLICKNLREQERLSVALDAWKCPHAFLPEREQDIEGRPLADPEAAADRLQTLCKITQSSPASSGKRGKPTLLTRAALDQPTPTPAQLTAGQLQLKVGSTLAPEQLAAKFTKLGYQRVPQIYARQQFAQRGGILDFFGASSPHPIRIEFFDEDIDSLREFDLDSQGTLHRHQQLDLLLNEPKGTAPLNQWLNPKQDWVISIDEVSIDADIIITPDYFLLTEEPISDASTDEGNIEELDELDEISGTDERNHGACFGSPLGQFAAGDFILGESKRQQLINQLQEWLDEQWQVAIFFPTEGEQSRFFELLNDSIQQSEQPAHPIPSADFAKISPVRGRLEHGFTIPHLRLAILSASEIFGRFQTPRPKGRRNAEENALKNRAQAQTHEFQPNDLVVHAEYGIGRFNGIKTLTDGSQVAELIYRDDATLEVPLDHAHLIARYIGLGGKTPPLNKLGDGKWARTRAAAESAIVDYAAKLLQVQARRQIRNGFAFPPDTQWMWEFEQSFPYKETHDQLRAIQEVKQDMESPRPMDRLICGDVGFGKTEVAIRAAFKAVCSGKQVAILAPTTVLAEQHWHTFRERMSDFPFQIELLSRFRSGSEIKQALHAITNGSADIAIGTHRLISKDVSFKNLGLVVIDEEQRFGVKHKEKFKQLFENIDILTLSATPIPRTLYLSLMGARDMSTIDTPPANRRPVSTTVCPYDERLIRRTIQREVERGGQVFFLHNRVKTIEQMRQKIELLVPDVRVVVGHGQMDKSELENVMHTFIAGDADVLLATTIIESGIDIPNANTILIDRADRFGLADLYQLRGRVGRGGHQAYAYLLLPQSIMTTDARKRVNAIQQYTDLGSGFKIAMRDLEIRGAGNLLGTRQSGQIAAVGFDLYCQLLQQSIRRLQGRDPEQRIEVYFKADFVCFSEASYLGDTAPAGFPAFIPVAYLADPQLRIRAYKDLAELATHRQLEKLAANWRDRFGPLPPAVENLLLCTKTKIAASIAHITSIEILGQRLMLKRNNQFIQLPGNRFPRLNATTSSKKLNEAITLIETLT